MMINKQNAIGSKILSSHFMWHPADKSFSQEASSLPRSFNPESQIWNDSYDTGFIMVSERTSNNIVFSKAHTHRSTEGEITHWSFTAHPNLNRGVITERILLTIWND